MVISFLAALKKPLGRKEIEREKDIIKVLE